MARKVEVRFRPVSASRTGTGRRGPANLMERMGLCSPLEESRTEFFQVKRTPADEHLGLSKANLPTGGWNRNRGTDQDLGTFRPIRARICGPCGDAQAPSHARDPAKGARGPRAAHGPPATSLLANRPRRAQASRTRPGTRRPTGRCRTGSRGANGPGGPFRDGRPRRRAASRSRPRTSRGRRGSR